MAGKKIASKHNLSRALRNPNVYIALAGVTLASMSGSIDQAQAKSTARSISSWRSKVTNTAENMAAKVLHDFHTAPKSEKSSAAGMRGVELLLIQYPATNRINKKPARYVIEASITKDRQGALRPRRVNSVILQEQTGSDQIYEFEIARTNNSQQWNLNLDIITGTSLDHYAYTTGRAFPQESLFPLTLQAFRPIARQAEGVLASAGHRPPAPITQPAIPFPPPELTHRD